MTDTVTIALITASGSALVAITALLLNYRGFSSIDSRFSSVDSRFSSIDNRFSAIDSRFAALEHRLEAIHNDLKEFYKILADHDKRISRLEDQQ